MAQSPNTPQPNMPKFSALLQHTSEQPSAAAHSESPAPAQTSEPNRKRPRAAQACDRCRAKKYKCDESFPCFFCRKHGYDCIYQGSTPRAWERTVNSSYVESLERKVRELEASSKTPKTYSPATIPPSPHQQQYEQPDRQFAALPTRNEDQRPSEQTQYGPISASPYGPPTAANNYQNSSRVRARESDAGRLRYSITEDDSPTETAHENEIRDVNSYTKNLEYYGPNSAMSVLGNLQREKQSHEQLPSVVSLLHNSAFEPNPFGRIVNTSHELHIANKFYFRVAHTFMEGYFESLHSIHPIIDRHDFTVRAENLWFGRLEKTTFKGLYLTLMALGALMRIWDEEKIEGLSRLEWCRKLFDEAQVYFHQSAMSFDIETVQGFFLMAKVCQNQLAPQLAYMYLGIGVRTALAAGYNRSNPKTSTPSPESDSIARTWWGLYSLEVEMSFSLGRPDSLGVDAYHNQRLPESRMPSTNESETSIITHTLPLARIIRRVSVEIYHSSSSISRKLSLATDIHSALSAWNANLPLSIRPDGAVPTLRESKWARRQRLVLGIRYRNVQMAMYRPFLAYYTRTNTRSAGLRDAVNRCVAAAMETITMMHQIFLQHTFFRTWWWNVTYISFPASVLLTYIARHPQGDDEERQRQILGSVARAIEVLEAMDGCLVAKRAAQLISNSLREVSADGAVQDHTNLGTSRTPAAAVAPTARMDGTMSGVPPIFVDSEKQRVGMVTAAYSSNEHRLELRDGIAAIDGRLTPGSSGAPTPQTLTMDDFNYADLLLEEGWSTLFDDFDLNTPLRAQF